MLRKEDLKYKDEYCTEFVIEQITAVKKYFGITNSKRIYALGCWCNKNYFLCHNNIFIAKFDRDSKNNLIFKSLYTVTLKDKNIIDLEIMISDDTTHIYTQEDFINWYNSPCCVNEYVNVPYSKAIEFLQNYKKETFNQGRYLFYAKRDKDFTWLYFIYAYDLLTKIELKIYVDSYINTDFPEKISEIYIKDLSGKLSNYQKLQCKKAFLKYCKQECKELNAPNFYALEFVKQCIQPIYKDKCWAVNRPFLCDSEFDNIWIDDVLRYDEKPYFMVCNNNQWTITKIAVLDFYKPEYKSTEPYINAYMKRNHWDMDNGTLERLVKFLKAPFDNSKFQYANKDYVKGKTNWQMLIEMYNYNTAQYNERYNKLPLDIPMPDYTKLAKD